jgi:RNA ligase
MSRLDINMLNPYIEAGLIDAKRHPSLPLTIYNYSRECQYNEAWDDITIQCRGLILDDSGKVIARGFDKFFNYEETYGRDLIPLKVTEIIVQEKMDGSLGILFYYGGSWHMATRGSFCSEQAVKGLEMIESKYDLSGFHKKATYLCEIIYPENRIVVNYDSEKIMFLSAVVKNKELSWESCKWLFAASGIKTEDIVDSEPVLEFKESAYIALKNKNLENKEGFVVKFEPSNFRVKIKFEEYVRLHRILTNFSNVDIWEILMRGEDLDRFLDQVPDEFDKWVRDWKDRLVEEFTIESNRTDEYYSQIIELGLETRKDQAAWIMSNPDPRYRSLLFLKLDERSVSDAIWKMIRPDYEKPIWKW